MVLFLIYINYCGRTQLSFCHISFIFATFLLYGDDTMYIFSYGDGLFIK